MAEFYLNKHGEMFMTTNEIIKLYEKERQYQKNVFGEYKNNPSLNLASFLAFIETYIDRAIKDYSEKWTNKKPEWLLASSELIIQGSCPMDTYESLIKIFALSGAALETYSAIDVSKWRNDGIKDKWKDEV